MTRPFVMRTAGRRPPARRRANTSKVSTPSTPEDQHRAHEDIIRRSLTAFVEVGNALRWIRDNGTYKSVGGYKTFEEYVKAEWDMARRTAYQQIDAAVVVENVRHGAQIAPINERQVRPLVGLEPGQQREAWTRVVEKVEGERPTGRQVAQVVKAMKEETNKVQQNPNQEDTSAAESPTAKLEEITSQLAKQGKKMLQTLTAIDDLLEEHGYVEGLGPLAETLHGVHERVDFLMKKLGAPKVADSPQPRQLALE